MQCWNRLTAIYGVKPPPNEKKFRMIFGTRIRRTLTKSGVTVLGVRYHSAHLAAHLAQRGKMEVDVRWHPENIGCVSLKIGDRWMDVPSVMEEFSGVSAAAWLTAAKHMRLGRHRAREIDTLVALEAMAAISERSHGAVIAAGMTVSGFDAEGIHRAESRVFAGVTFRELGSAIETPRDEAGLPGLAIPEPIDPPKAPGHQPGAASEPAAKPARKAVKPSRPKPSGRGPMTVEED